MASYQIVLVGFVHTKLATDVEIVSFLFPAFPVSIALPFCPRYTHHSEWQLRGWKQLRQIILEDLRLQNLLPLHSEVLFFCTVPPSYSGGLWGMKWNSVPHQSAHFLFITMQHALCMP